MGRTPPVSGPLRVAAVDIGSNSVKLHVADVEGGRLTQVVDRIWLPRLSEGVFRRGRISPAAEARTLAALREARLAAQAAGAQRLVAAATEAVRQAKNGGAFLARASEALGAEVEALSARAEARWAFLGATRDLGARTVTLLDVGGGSTEVSHGRGGLLWRSVSIPLGCVRVLEAMPREDPPREGSVRAVREEIARRLQRVPRSRALLVGIGGTAATLARMLRGPQARWTELDRASLSLAEIEACAGRMAELPLAERRCLPGLRADRADIVLPGTWILLEAMRRIGSRRLLVRTLGLRHGLALRAAPPFPKGGGRLEVTRCTPSPGR